MQALLLILKLLPMLLDIVRMIQQHRLTQQATDEMIADLQQTADYLVTRANLAREEVQHAPSDIEADPYNRD
jgi:hypothetical protein